MMTDLSFTEIRDALYAPFPLADHTIREGHRNRAKTKIQWFVYLGRGAVQRRLDDVLPFQWEFRHIATTTAANFVTVTAEIVINGMSRAYNGGQEMQGGMDEDVEKGAMTEAFRRCASMWGVGLYLYEMDEPIWTDAYPEGDWDAQKARKAEAMAKFTKWYAKQFGSVPNAKPVAGQPQAQPAGSQEAGGKDGSGKIVKPGVDYNLAWPLIFSMYHGTAKDEAGSRKHAQATHGKLVTEWALIDPKTASTDDLLNLMRAYKEGRESGAIPQNPTKEQVMDALQQRDPFAD